MLLSEISPLLKSESTYLSGFDGNDDVEIDLINETNHEILLKYIKSECPLPKEIWTDDILNIIGVLMISADKLKFDCIFYGNNERKAMLHNHKLSSQMYDLWLYNKPTNKWCEESVKFRNLECLKYAHQKGYKFGEAALIAAKNDDIECFKYINENSVIVDKNKIIETAAHNSSIKFLTYVLEQGYVLGDAAALITVKHDDIECLKYINENSTIVNKNNIVEKAAYHGSIKCLKYVLEQKFPYSNNILLNAIHEGHFECVEYILTIISSAWLDENAHKLIVTSVRGGQFEMMKYLNNRGYHFSFESVKYALRKKEKSIDYIKYMHENGYEFTTDALDEAVRWDEKCLDYLISIGCPFNVNSNIIGSGCKRQHLQYFHERGLILTDYMALCATYWNNLEGLIYLHQNGMKLDDYMCTQAVYYDNLDMLKYLLENGCKLDIDEILENGKHIFAGPKKCIEYLEKVKFLNMLDNLFIC